MPPVFTYKSGDRPLDGYTLKRGIGQGGFGEVYFGLSDGGKEVALKLLRGHTDIELRGVMNCLNLKHPNLVHLYDLREDERGNKWLVMEYVVGESLDRVMNRYPRGVSVSLAKEWFGALARAVAHLHDRGVVHRDLKPANLFLEAGCLKVGDYGLCKTLDSTQRQTRTVGTVHYMAPEVSSGNYNQKIDIYAAGVILHEMLTGKLPFDGQTDGEILVQHQTCVPDLSAVPASFRPIIAKALEKKAERRYGSMLEMARAVEAVELPVASPATAARATGAATDPIQRGVTVALPQPRDLEPEILEKPTVALPIEPPTPPAQPMRAMPLIAKPPQPLGWRERTAGLFQALVLVPFIAAAGLVPYALVVQSTQWPWLAKMLLVTTGLGWIVLLGSGTATAMCRDSWARRLRLGLLGLLVGALAYWLDGHPLPTWLPSQPLASEVSLMGLGYMSSEALAHAARYLLYYSGVLTIGHWWSSAARDRKERISFLPIVSAAFFAGILLFLWPWTNGSAANGLVPFVLCSIAVQAASPWSPRLPVSVPKKLRLQAA